MGLANCKITNDVGQPSKIRTYNGGDHVFHVPYASHFLDPGETRTVYAAADSRGLKVAWKDKFLWISNKGEKSLSAIRNAGSDCKDDDDGSGAFYERHVQKRTEEMEEQARKRSKEMVDLQASFNKLSLDFNNLKKERANPKKYAQMERKLWSSFITKIGDVEQPAKRGRPAIAIIGKRGVGKSSTVNRLVGSEVAVTGVKDTTMEVTMAYGQLASHKFEVWDVPGETDERTYANWQILEAMMTMHVIIVEYTDAVESAFKCVEIVSACKVPVIVVRNKIDQITQDDAEVRGMSLQDLRDETHRDEEKALEKRIGTKHEIIFAVTQRNSSHLGVNQIKRKINFLLGQNLMLEH